MDPIRTSILTCRSSAPDDATFINDLNSIIEQHGFAACQTIFQVLTSLELPAEKAAEYWRSILKHREGMIAALRRNVDLVPALCDFLSTCPDHFEKPKIVDESYFARVIEGTTHDSLTTLFNRPYFNEILEQNLSLAKRYNTDLSILFLDVDDFKDINDTYGHGVGDTTLQTIASVIKQEKRDSDIAARYGGEEFVLLMPHTENIHAFVLAERIRNRIEQLEMTGNGQTYRVTISGGLASFPCNAHNSDELLHKADSALYLAKGAGKNTISFFKEEKRRYLRVKFNQPVKVKELGFNSSPAFDSTSKDICIGGILFENSALLPLGARIQVSVPTKGDEPLLLIGTVVRVETFNDHQYDIGMTISFKEMDKIANTEIANFLKDQQNEEQDGR
jgi:diguanylate cyclase (GGDEF)-like protein